MLTAIPAAGRTGAGTEGGVESGTAASRKGRPIVLTLQAILAATSPSSPAAAAIEAAAEASARAEDSPNTNADTCCPESVGPPPPVAIADRAQFPPLLLRGASADKGPGLFLAPPITMVKNGEEQPDAGSVVAVGMQSGSADGRCGGQVSCSEAVAATTAAEAAAHVRDGGGADAGAGAVGGEVGAVAGAGGGMSRIGWWLRWATTTSGADVVGATANGQQGDSCQAGGGVVSLATSNGADGWQVVSAPASGVPPIPVAAMAAEASPAALVDSEDEDDEGGSWCDFAAEAADIGEMNAPPAPLAVRDDDGGGAVTPAVTIEDALKRAAGGTIYDDGSSFAGDEDEAYEDENSVFYTPASNDKDGHRAVGAPPPQIIALSPNVPRSFRDTLMAPSATGAVRFSDSKAVLRARAAAALPGSSSSSSPTLVAGGADGGAVFLWRKAAAGEGELSFQCWWCCRGGCGGGFWGLVSVPSEAVLLASSLLLPLCCVIVFQLAATTAVVEDLLRVSLNQEQKSLC